jgi:KUP system potassium uptake protein
MSTRPPLPLSTGAKAAMSIGALGVVFGDIGTSPLYAFRECLAHLPPVERTEGILGALSLVFWALVIEVSIKYLGFVMRADNRGEGGIFALLALSHVDGQPTGRRKGLFTLLILFGAALLYGDGVITPAISVLGAAEGLKSFNPIFNPYIPAIACVILAGLFWFQHKGSKALGTIFGPVMLIWFATLAVLGVWRITEAPVVFTALNPLLGLKLLIAYPWHATALLGAVILVITGAEALYADMGHFGRTAISRAWYFGAFPGLILNYFGQGAFALSHPTNTDHPFFTLVPAGAPRLALIALSIAAAIIASQALISGTFSLTRQAMQLGYFPRLSVKHTNANQAGQIYLPLVNWTLAIAAIVVVLGFGSSNRLATAYGVAVTGTMVVTTLAFYRVIRYRWRWPLWKAWPLCAAFVVFDLAFFISNLHKFAEGGWLPLAIAFVMLAIMHTWKTGRT